MLGVDVSLILNTILEFSLKMINNLNPVIIRMFISFVIIDVVLSFVFDDSDGLTIFIKLTKKILYYSFFYYIIKEYKYLVYDTLFPGAIQLANYAVDGSTATSLDFNVLNKFGVELGDITGSLLTGAGFVALDVFGVESATTVGLMAVVGYLLFFIMLYVQIITTFIKFYLTGAFAYILLPFAGFEKTKEMTSKALNGVMSSVIEVFVLVVLLKYADYLDDFNFFDVSGGIKSTLWTRWVLIVFLYFLLNKAGTIASAMMSGAIASLGIGASTQSSAFSKMSGAGGIANADLNRASSKRAENRYKENGRSVTGQATMSAYKGATNMAKNLFNK